MCSTRWLGFAGALGLVLGSAGQFTLRADESAEARAVRLVDEAGGIVTRDATAADTPVVAVSLCGAKLSDDLLKALVAFPRLRALDLCHTEGLTSKRVKFLAELKELEALNVSRCDSITGHGMYKLAALKNLRVLDVSHCAEIDDCGLEALTEFFPKLRVLNISGCKAVTARGLRELRHLCDLEVLTAANCDFADDAIREIAETPHLRSLSIANSTRVTVNGLKVLASLENLEVLDLSGMSAATSGPLYVMSGKLQKLHTLNLANCPRLANHSLKCLSRLKQLHTLNVAGCTQLEDYGIEYLLQSAPNLKVLDLSGCIDINDDAIKFLTKFAQLESLDIRGCKSVSAAGAKALADAMPKLKLDR